jgi:hypothetical protein
MFDQIAQKTMNFLVECGMMTEDDFIQGRA